MWNRTSQQQGPETCSTHMGTERGNSNKGGNHGSRGAAPHKHTHQKTHESRQHTCRAASFTAFLSPLDSTVPLFHRDGCVDLQKCCVLWVSMSTSCVTSVSMGAQAATCTITDSEARHSTGLTHRKRDSADGFRVELKTPRGKSSPVRVTCTNLATNEITGKDSTPIDATGT